jgi:aliphatic sulfonates family ABC transporter substrate-binding protein
MVCPLPVLTLTATTPNPLSIRAKALVFEDPASHELLSRIRKIAPSDAPVLITGETGTGKELVARELHAQSRRAQQQFVAINAGAFSEQLIESELFGHDKGAFTGAHLAKPGWFETADGGTLFLDEIGDLPLPLQVKLLRVLQEGEVTRLGARTATRVDVRLIAATNVDLEAAIRARRFREDLFYRLRVTSLTLPPLRDRPADILPLARHFLALYAGRLGQSGMRLSPDASRELLLYPWPGNIRELENAIHHALLVCEGNQLEASDLQLSPSSVRRSEPAPSATSGTDTASLAKLEHVLLELLEQKLPHLHERVEATLLGATYRYCGRNQLETARLLGMSRNVVRARLIEFGELAGPLRRTGSSLQALAPAPRVRSRPIAQRAGTLRVGYQKLGLLMLVKASGRLDAALAAQGTTIEWSEYEGGMQIVDALRSLQLDLGVVGDCPAVFAQAQDVPIVYVAAEPPAPRGAALIVPESSPLRSVSDLRGRRVAVNWAAQAHYLLMLALEEAGVDPLEVEIHFEPPERALRSFQAGSVDAWAIWDPWLSDARLELGARVLRDATGLLKNSAYYVARREFAERQPEILAQLRAELQTVAAWAQHEPARAANLVAPGFGVSARALAASFDRELRSVGVTREHVAAQQHIADTLLRLQLIPRAISVADAEWQLAG